MKRPIAIAFSWRDPWTDEFCSGATLAYSPQRAAAGFYSRSITNFKKIARQHTAMRTPVLRIQFIRKESP